MKKRLPSSQWILRAYSGNKSLVVMLVWFTGVCEGLSVFSVFCVFGPACVCFHKVQTFFTMYNRLGHFVDSNCLERSLNLLFWINMGKKVERNLYHGFYCKQEQCNSPTMPPPNHTKGTIWL